MLVALVQVGLFDYALGRLGISPAAALLLLLASLAGSAVNLPVARLRNQVVQVRRTVSVFGVRYMVPVLTRRRTTIAVNAGGALLPVAVSAYLIAHDRIGWLALAATAIVAALVVGCGTLPPSGIRQNRRHVIESLTSAHRLS